MRIASVKLKNFKRFTNLTVSSIPKHAKIILVVGSNGGGKSSFFEAFNLWHNVSLNAVPDYHAKFAASEKQTSYNFVTDSIDIEFYDRIIKRSQADSIFSKIFYFRTSNRYESDFTSKGIERRGPLLGEGKPALLINEDKRVGLNYNRIAAQALDELFTNDDISISAYELRERLISKIRDSMRRVFDDLVLEGVGNPSIDGTFFFSKGQAKNYKYKNLSAGEKAAFDLILDLIVRSEYFDDSVFFIDEPELHIHLSLQAKLFAEIYRIIPEQSQLWVATHSLGILSEALKMSRLTHDIYFLDFHNIDFDQKVDISPVEPNKSLISNIYTTTLGSLANLLAPSEIILCEGSIQTSGKAKNSEFDARILNAIFSNEHPNTQFISFGGSNDLDRDNARVRYLLSKIVSAANQFSLIDRDDRSEQEIRDAREEGLRVLSRRDLENYIWDTEIIYKYLDSVGKDELKSSYDDIFKEVKTSAQTRGIMPDDMKQFSGEIYVKLRRILSIPGLGQKKESFIFDQLVKLITPETNTYKALERDIFQEGE